MKRLFLGIICLFLTASSVYGKQPGEPLQITIKTDAEVLLNESNWSRPSNGLSAKLVFSYDDSQSYAKVICPKLLLRNDSREPVKFLALVDDYGANQPVIFDLPSIRSGYNPKS